MMQSTALQSKLQKQLEKLKGVLNSECQIQSLDESQFKRPLTPLLNKLQPSSDFSDREGLQQNLESNSIGLKSLNFLDEYILGEKLGEGTNGIVRLCWKREQVNSKYAVKIITTTDEEIQTMVKQSFINSQLFNSPFIAKSYKLYIEPSKMYLLMEWVPFHNLEQLLKIKGKLKEWQVQQIALTLLKAVNCLHKAGVCHRDIKPDNIQIQEDFKIKLIDFGVSRRFVTYNQNTFRYNRNRMITITGNIYYRAPDIYAGYGYDQQIDLWAIGVVIYQCLTGMLPYYSNSQLEFIDILTSKEAQIQPFQREEFLRLPPSCRDFLKRIMSWNPLQRLNASEALRHIWIPIYRSPNRILPVKVKDDIDASKISQNSDIYNKQLISSAMVLNQELAHNLLKKVDPIKEEETPQLQQMEQSLEVSINFDNNNDFRKKLELFKLASSTKIHETKKTKNNTVQYIQTIHLIDSSENQLTHNSNRMNTSIHIKQEGATKNIKDLLGFNLCESHSSFTQLEDIPIKEEEITYNSHQMDTEFLMEVSQFEKR